MRQPKVDFKSQKHPAELDEALQRGDGDPPQTVMSWVPLGRAKNKPLTCARDSGRYSLLILVHLRSARAFLSGCTINLLSIRLAGSALRVPAGVMISGPVARS